MYYGHSECMICSTASENLYNWGVLPTIKISLIFILKYLETRLQRYKHHFKCQNPSNQSISAFLSLLLVKSSIACVIVSLTKYTGRSLRILDQ